MTLLFKPMKAYLKTPDLKEIVYPCIASPKLDGIRCIMADGIAWSNSMKRIPNKFIQDKLGELELHGLDGELMVDGDFENVQSAVMSIGGKPDFYLNVFDDFHYTGGFVDRHKHATEQVAKLHSNRVRLVHHTRCDNVEELQAFWEHCIKEGYEGAMVRAPMGPYKRGRSTLKEGYLLKLKVWHDDEGVVVDFTELERNANDQFTGELGQTKRSHEKAGMVAGDTLGCLVLQWNGQVIEVGSGFTEGQRREIWDNREDYIGQRITFKYQNLTKYGKPRFPIFKGVRHD